VKIALAAVIAFLAVPAAAFGEASITMREMPLHGERTLAAATPRFDMVGLHWRGSGSVEFRTRSIAGRWNAWRPAAPEAEDLPDHPSRSWRLGNPYWVGDSDRIAYQLRGRITRLRAYFIQSDEERIPLRRVAMAGSPPLISRPAWGANEAIRRAVPSYARTVQLAIVHHTAGTNAYSASQSAAIVRGIEVYHVKGNGWNDIGYNFLVDKFGGLWEGRGGGIDRPVVGAHVLGFNSGSTGVALIGDFGGGPAPGAAIDGAGRLLGWKLSLTGVDPTGTNNFRSGDPSSGAKYPAGTVVNLNNISGHQDANYTDCPGQAEGQLPQIRTTALAGFTGFLAYPAGFRGGVYVGSGEFTGDWISEVITGAGPGGGPAVGVWRDTGVQLGGFMAFPVGFHGGVRVTSGRVEPSGPRDVITAAGPGGGPAVEVFHTDGSLVRGFYAYDVAFNGGVWVASGNVNPVSPSDEIVTGAGEGGGPHLRIFSNTGSPIGGFMAYPTAFHGGVHVASGDVDGDGVEEIITGAGPGGGPQVNVFKLNGQLIGSFMAYAPGFLGGVYVGTVPSPDGKTKWIITGAGEGGGTQARVFDWHGNVGGNGFFYGPPNDTSGVRLAGGAFIGQVPGQVVVTEGPGSLPLVGFRRLDGPAFTPTT